MNFGLKCHRNQLLVFMVKAVLTVYAYAFTRIVWVKILTLILVLIATQHAAGKVYYVDVSQADNNSAGTSWSAAKKDIQSAIMIAKAGDSIWVKKGTYYPSMDKLGNMAPNDPRSKSFFLKGGIKVFGGFAGNESYLNQRNPTINVTELSGDIGIAADSSDNCYNVVTATNVDSTAVLEGFVVKDGYADGFNYGGGLICYNSFLTISNCIITKNATENGGGGMYVAGNSNPNLRNVSINNNYAYDHGGGIYIDNASAQLRDVTIDRNIAFTGGGIYCVWGSPTLEHVNLTNNVAYYGDGGGIHINSGTPVLFNVVISGNSAEFDGGGFYCYAGGQPQLTNVVFSNNSAESGGAMCNSGCPDFSMKNIVLYHNTAVFEGGAIYNANTSPKLINATIIGNIASFGDGGGIICTNSAIPRIINSVFWGNRSISGPSDITNRSSYYDSCSNNASDLGMNSALISVDSHFVSLASYRASDIFRAANDPLGLDKIWFTTDDGLMPANVSPLIDSGATSIPPTPNDIVGNSRIGQYDIGAYEFQKGLNAPTVQNENVSVTVFPNPSKGQIRINAPAPVCIQIRSLDGKCVIKNRKTNQVDLSTLSDGAYIVDISAVSGTFHKTERIIKSSL